MKIIFSHHSKDKIEVLKKHGFDVKEDFIIKTLEKPDVIMKSCL